MSSQIGHCNQKRNSESSAFSLDEDVLNSHNEFEMASILCNLLQLLAVKILK